jgi:hypothetical protein
VSRVQTDRVSLIFYNKLGKAESARINLYINFFRFLIDFD